MWKPREIERDDDRNARNRNIQKSLTELRERQCMMFACKEKLQIGFLQNQHNAFLDCLINENKLLVVHQYERIS